MNDTTDRWVVRYKTTGRGHEWHLFELVSVGNANVREMRRKCDGERVTVGGGDRYVSEARPAGETYMGHGKCAACVEIDDKARKTAFAFSLSEMFAVPVHVFTGEPGACAGCVTTGIDGWVWGVYGAYSVWHAWVVGFEDGDSNVLTKACELRKGSPERVDAAGLSATLPNPDAGKLNCHACASLWPWIGVFHAGIEDVEAALETSRGETREALRERDEAVRASSLRIRERDETARRIEAFEYDGERRAATNRRLVDENVTLAGKLREAQARLGHETTVSTHLREALARVAGIAEDTVPPVAKAPTGTRYGRIVVDTGVSSRFTPVCALCPDGGRHLMIRATRNNAIEALAAHVVSNHGNSVPVRVYPDGWCGALCTVDGCPRAVYEASGPGVRRAIARHEITAHAGEGS